MNFIFRIVHERLFVLFGKILFLLEPANASDKTVASSVADVRFLTILTLETSLNALGDLRYLYHID